MKATTRRIDTPPDLQEELNRKSFETLDWLFSALDRGAINESQFSTGIDALFMATGGLTDRKTFNLITEASKLAGKAPIDSRHFLKDFASVVTIAWQADESSFVTTVRTSGAPVKVIKKEFDSASKARDAMILFGDKLTAAGYHRL